MICRLVHFSFIECWSGDENYSRNWTLRKRQFSSSSIGYRAWHNGFVISYQWKKSI
jgi:hypothetical protein